MVFAYLAYLLIGSVSMFGIGCVGVRKKRNAWDSLTFSWVRLHIKEIIRGPAELFLCIFNCLPESFQLKKIFFSTEKQYDVLSLRGIHSPCVFLALISVTCTQ